MCLTARPLAIICGDFGEDFIEDDFDDDFGDDETPEQERACDRLDSLEFPAMPPYLEDLLFELEDRYAEDNYDNHIPGACRDAGITGRGEGDRERCFAIMIRIEAPPECREALIAANVRSEREARDICGGIIFEREAPRECVERGITSPEECGRFFEDEFGFGDRGYDYGGDCRNLEDAARLVCYDRASSGGGFDDGRSFEERFRETKELERQCAEGCASEGKAWDFSNGCTCHGGGYQSDYSEYYDEYYFPEEEYYPEEEPYNDYQESSPECPPDAYWDGYTCVGSEPPPSDEPPPQEEPPIDEPPPAEEQPSEEPPAEEPPAEESSGESGTTGSVIRGGYITGNAFLDYHFGFWRWW